MIEYLFKTLPMDGRMATDELNVLARQGWRVVHAQVDRHMLWYLLLERDLEEADND